MDDVRCSIVPCVTVDANIFLTAWGRLYVFDIFWTAFWVLPIVVQICDVFLMDFFDWAGLPPLWLKRFLVWALLFLLLVFGLAGDPSPG